MSSVAEAEERYLALVEHAGEGVVVMVDDRFVFANRRAEEILRLPRERILAEGIMHLLHPEDNELVSERRRRRFAGEDVPSRYQVRLVDPDGSVRWMEMGVALVPWSGQVGTMTFFSDITERKAMVDALHRSEERYRAVVEHSGDGLVVVQNERFVFVNRRAEAIVRLPREEMMRHGFLHSIHPDDRALVLERQRRRLAGEQVPDRYELRLLLEGGDIIWIEIGVTLVPWDGQMATLTFFSDITQRKLLEAQLHHTLGEREAILNTALVGISYNVGRRIVWVNDKFTEMLGWSREEVVNQPSRLFYRDDESYNADGVRTREGLSRDGFYRTERELIRRDGETIWVELAGRCVRGLDPDAGVIWTLLDITERRRAEESARAAVERQRELNDLRARFVSMTSHEFRTPLATILSSAELLRHYGERMGAQDRADVLQSVEGAVRRMTMMIDRVLLIGRADAQMLQCRPREVDLESLCLTLVQEARAAQPGSPCAISVEVDPQRVSGVFDPELLRHALGNLLSNALKYSPAGGQVRLVIAAEGTRTRFEVHDQGMGIPPLEIPHLFESFHRASNVGEIQGTGLGLVIARKSVELHGGQVTVRSAPGEGTCFAFTLGGPQE
ncbi:MAG: PAS domain S-box protein [Ramlibacter sp.]|jgi:PAS domain S-box-containing protein|nr:PAS domain S-box protein [Ramlibacter sp.]